jgi:hypothetical protein
MVGAFVIGIVLLVYGIWLGGRTFKQQDLLTRFEWERYNSEYLPFGAQGTRRPQVRLLAAAHGEESTVTLDTTLRWTPARSGLIDSQELLVAGTLPGYAVLRTQKGRLLSAHSPKK